MARRGVRQSALATALGITQQSVSARLNGRVAFTVDELETVAGSLDLTLADLIDPTSARLKAEA